MSDVRRPAVFRSVFARLVVIMAMTGVLVIVLVGGFYFAIVIPGIHASLNDAFGPHVRAIAETHPDLGAARRFAEHVGMSIRFEGPDTTWATDPSVPVVSEIRQRHAGWASHFLVPRRTYYIVPVEDGRYVFSRSVSGDFGHAHTVMLVTLLVLMAAVFATAYLVIRRALRPLRLLGAGVAALGEGRLDVAVPRQSDDEFGLLTDAFNRMAGRVREMLGARERLLRDVSHELRSPLTRMKVALEMMPEGAQRRAMQDDVAEMEALVTQLLELERLREGPRPAPVRDDLVALVRAEARRAGERPPGVVLGAMPGSLDLDLDPEGVRTVLRNLLDNAIGHALPDSAPVEVSVRVEGGDAIVRVADDGEGFPAEDRDRLFEPFFRADVSRSRSSGGFGLGLSICRRIMEAHGGSIEAERRTPRGAAFVLRFPFPGR